MNDPLNLDDIRRLVALGDSMPRREHRLLSLLLETPRALSRSDLISGIWPDPDLEPDYAKDTLEVYLVRLRKRLRAIGYRINGRAACPRSFDGWNMHRLERIPADAQTERLAA
jgi:DNA-binding response OmpR family regulator